MIPDTFNYKLYESMERQLEKIGFEYIKAGSFRVSFQRGNVVVKIPRNRDGIIDNMIEARAWRHYKRRPTSLGLRLAPCRLLPGFCLMMVKVNLEYYRRLPKWANNVDSCQVGIYKGRLVAYDYALNLTERFRWEEEMSVQSNFFHDEWLGRHPELKEAQK